jgi:glutamyl-tRNA synthetase
MPFLGSTRKRRCLISKLHCIIMAVVTRFAPSPTGFLHIGGARTALFNYLYAKHTGGTFLLRIEDTDRARSTQEAIDAILGGLNWIGLPWDGEVIFQAARADAHRVAADRLLAAGKAYHCFCTPEELTAMREDQKAKGLSVRYDGRWRDRDPKDAPTGIEPVVRFKAPLDGETVIDDLIQGPVTVSNTQLDDMILLRSDGSPTYMLSVVIDDIDMGITHVIRGDDHLNNAFRQIQLIHALGGQAPSYAHMPLIHGADGAKLSKRHGALGVEAYRDMGVLPEALRNYLLRLGWSHGDDEIISDAQAIKWFDIKDVGRAPSRFDFDKLTNLNGHYIRETPDTRLVDFITPSLQTALGKALNTVEIERLTNGMPGLKSRAKSINELSSSALFYVHPRPLPINEKAAKALADDEGKILQAALKTLPELMDWTSTNLDTWARALADESGQKLGKVAQPMRAALCGSTISPSIFEVMEVLGKEESLARFNDVLGN